MDKRFQWTEFYMELASALLHYKNNRSELIAKLKTIFADDMFDAAGICGCNLGFNAQLG